MKATLLKNIRRKYFITYEYNKTYKTKFTVFTKKDFSGKYSLRYSTLESFITRNATLLGIFGPFFYSYYFSQRHKNKYIESVKREYHQALNK